MLFTQFDQRSIASLAGAAIRSRLYLIGNPAIAARIVRIDVRGSLYVPFRVALFQPDEASGTFVFFDRPELREIGLSLDAKIDAVVQQVRDA